MSRRGLSAFPTDPMLYRPLVRPALAYAAVVAVLWPLPVFGLLHAESGAVVAAAAFFVSAVAAVGALERGEALGRVTVRSLALLAVPLAGLTVSLLWRPNCAYGTGLGLFAVLVPPSAVLGVAVAAALVASGVRRPRLGAVVVGIAVALGGTVWDLGFHPQLFTTNAVYGGVLGPIYDEELSIRPGLFVARGETLLWAGVLVCWARWRGGGGGRPARLGAVLLGVLGVATLAAVPLGVQQSAAGLERVLSRRVDAGPVVLHLAPETTAADVRRLTDEARFRLAQVETRLGVRASEPVHLYLYPDEATKGRLIGSRQTSVVPVWLSPPQVHMLADEVGRSLGHELVHVVAREFGMPVLRASPAVGLVEGLAVAVEPPDGLPAPEALVAAGLTLGDVGGLDADPAAVVRAAMTPLGFWSGRAGVSYTATGAFVGYTLRTCGPAAVRRAYRTGNVSRATGVPLDTLTARWAAHVRSVPVTAEARATAAWLFREPSLFEVRCPHHVPDYVRDTRAGAEALDGGDARTAASQFVKALLNRPDYAPALAGWVAAFAVGGNTYPGETARAIDHVWRDTAATALSLRSLADYTRLTNPDPYRLGVTDSLYARAHRRLVPTDRVGRLALRLRSRLSAEALRAVFSHPGDPARAAAGAEALAPFHAAVMWDEAGEAARAWRAIRRTPRRGLAPDEDAALLLVAARMAYHADDVAAAGRLAAASERGLRAAGADALAAVAADWRERVRWRAVQGAPGPSRVSAFSSFHRERTSRVSS